MLVLPDVYNGMAKKKNKLKFSDFLQKMLSPNVRSCAEALPEYVPV